MRALSVGVLFGFCNILDIVKSHIVKTTITILSQTVAAPRIYWSRRREFQTGVDLFLPLNEHHAAQYHEHRENYRIK